jgi:hypothetical protein
MRVDGGPGYRVYYTQYCRVRGSEPDVILAAGGSVAKVRGMSRGARTFGIVFMAFSELEVARIKKAVAAFMTKLTGRCK